MTAATTGRNINHLLMEQYKASQQQYAEQRSMIEAGYDDLMKAQMQSYEDQVSAMQQNHELQMNRFAALRKNQIELLDQQYGMNDEMVP